MRWRADVQAERAGLGRNRALVVERLGHDRMLTGVSIVASSDHLPLASALAVPAGLPSIVIWTVLPGSAVPLNVVAPGASAAPAAGEPSTGAASVGAAGAAAVAAAGAAGAGTLATGVPAASASQDGGKESG